MNRSLAVPPRAVGRVRWGKATEVFSTDALVEKASSVNDYSVAQFPERQICSPVQFPCFTMTFSSARWLEEKSHKGTGSHVRVLLFLRMEPSHDSVAKKKKRQPPL